jgi:pyrimidine operon attenuation protein/uracil phosphoribosyltransferase
MRPNDDRLCNADTMVTIIASMARTLWEGRRHGVPLHLVGIRSRGVPLADRLAIELRRLGAENVDVGAVEITLYRDDLGKTSAWPVLRGTEIPFDVDGADIVLVDDVLYTGRTVRAALNAICDLGRPIRVRLAVLVDRGHRELPIRADVAGIEVETNPEDRIKVRIRPIDPADDVVITVAGSPPA